MTFPSCEPPAALVIEYALGVLTGAGIFVLAQRFVAWVRSR